MKKLMFATVLIAAMLVGLTAQDTQREFIGATKCKMCHKKDKDGEQYPIWEKSAHAGAYKTLASAESKKIAKEMGIDDPQKADACLKCHVTGHGVDAKFLGKKYDKEEGVTCESCHGAGGDYYKKKTMQQIYEGKLDGATVGLLEPNEALCKTCHNEESPTFKGFDFAKMSKQIAHPIPPKK